MEEQGEPRDVAVDMGVSEVNLSPDAFHRYARHYYKGKQDFVCPDDGFSPVPYFLLCRAIELELKARHLTRRSQEYVKDKFRHKLSKAYRALDAREQILGQSEVAVLDKVSAIYADKGFEYFDRSGALKGFSQYPDLETLDTIAKKLIEAGA